MVDPVGSGAAAYGEPNELSRTTATESAVTELLLYRPPEGGRSYPWLEDYLTWLEGKETHRGYHAWLKQTPPWWERSMVDSSGTLRKFGLTPSSCTLETHKWMVPQTPEAAELARLRSHTQPSAAMDLADTTVTKIEAVPQQSFARAHELVLDRW